MNTKVFILLVFAVMLALLYVSTEARKERHELMRKYPECATAGKPLSCIQYKKILEVQND